MKGLTGWAAVWVEGELFYQLLPNDNTSYGPVLWYLIDKDLRNLGRPIPGAVS